MNKNYVTTTHEAIIVVLDMIDKAGSLLDYVECSKNEQEKFEDAIYFLQKYTER